MQYQLVMKQGRDNYQPFDLEMLSEFSKQQLTTLEGIDAFTSQFSNQESIKKVLLDANFIEADQLANELKIIFFENGRIREYKYGLCYRYNISFLNQDTIKNFIQQNFNNPQVLNKIYNEFSHKKDKSIYLEAILELLKNVKKFPNKDVINYIDILPYNEKRNLGMYIFTTFGKNLLNEDEYKEDITDGIRKIRINKW